MLKIINDSDPRLRARSLPVSLPLSLEEEEIAQAMLNYVKKSQDEEYAKKHNMQGAVGLAAPQIAVFKRLIAIYYLKENSKPMELLLANPRITASSLRECYLRDGEGCLSVPEKRLGRVYRPWKVTVEAYDILTKQEVKLILRGYDAVVIQHEIDHLNGVLYYDHIDPKRALEDDPSVVVI
ncbi:MAG: peptide deformylase [Bacilli bacterium]|jgi:peptide deformylase